MIIDLTKFMESLSTAVDYVENEFVKLSPYHGRRTAVLTCLMAEAAGMEPDEKYAATHLALLHDCAIAEYLKDEKVNEAMPVTENLLSAHCLAGEEMLKDLPFHRYAPGTILYHHERADGKGAFGKYPDEIPLSAQLIHMADVIDVKFSLYDLDEEKYRDILAWVGENAGTVFSEECASLFTKAVSIELLRSVAGDGCKTVLKELIPDRQEDIPVEVLKKMAMVFAKVTDYKSPFTRRHSVGIAEKAYEMGRYYGYPEEEREKLYIAGALHDVGKLLVNNNILEKPGKLSPDEYKVIQNHAMGTWNLLYGIRGMEDITDWAANHHEKLDGSGYPYGKKADELGKNERLLACLDIYQALVEDRPYKSGMPHGQAMEILNKMGQSGQLDTDILKDIDDCFGGSGIKEDRQEPVKAPALSGWKCPVCGYVYEGDELPENFICPDCEQPGSIFEKI